MSFVKAVPIQKTFQSSIYGEQGSGKTLTALLIAEGFAKLTGKRFAFIDTEKGTEYYQQRIEARKVHPEAFDFDILRTRSLSEALSGLRSLDPATHCFVVIDSQSHFWDAARDAWKSANPNAKDIPLRAWDSIKAPYKDLVRFLVDGPFHYSLVGRQKNLFEEDANGKLRSAGVGMRAEGETQYEPDFCLHMVNMADGGQPPQPTMFVEKDRSGILQGRTYPEPTFEVFRPILPFIGTGQRPTQTEDERAEQDAELMLEGSDKARTKHEKSAAILTEMTAKFAACTDLAGVAAVASECKKLRRNMTEEHLGVLRELHQSKRDTFAAATGGDL